MQVTPVVAQPVGRTSTDRRTMLLATSAGADAGTGGSSVANALKPFVCGGIAACFASCVIHPIDLIKVRRQLYATAVASASGGKPAPGSHSALGMLREMIKREGVRSLYAGLSAAVTRQAVYGTARIGLHRTFSQKLESIQGGKAIPFWQKALAGMASGSIAVTIGTPFDVSLVRMQADTMKPKVAQRGYKHVFDALLRVAREEGAGALYAGLAPNVLRGMAMNVGMLACYDQAKQTMLALLHESDAANPSILVKMGSSCIAGFCAAFFSLPFDMVKSRMMDMKADASGKMPYSGVVDCAAKIARNEGGIRAFWTGFLPYYGRTAPHAMLILMSIEFITDVYARAFQRS